VTGWLLIPVGVAAGGLHALLLGRAACANVHPLEVLLRLLLVIAVLFASAVFGHLLAGAGGWAGGFVIVAIILMGRLR
jgi:hypothetical protein